MRFNDTAPLYEMNAIPQKEAAHWGAEWLEKSLEGLVVKEFGAGTGLFSKAIEQRRPKEFYATDCSEKMIEEGAKKLKSAKWVKENAWAPLDGCYDRIYSASLLQWARNPVAVLRAWKERLGKDGKMVHVFFIEGSLKELNNVINDLEIVRWRSAESWLQSFSEAGLTVDRHETRENCYYYENVLSLLRQLRDSGVTTGHSWLKRYSRLRQAIETYEKKYRTNKGIPCTWQVMRVEAF